MSQTSTASMAKLFRDIDILVARYVAKSANDRDKLKDRVNECK